MKNQNERYAKKLQPHELFDDKVQAERFRRRWILNTGTNDITVKPDLTFARYLTERKVPLIPVTVLKPGEFAEFKSWFVVIHTSDLKTAYYQEILDEKTLAKDVEKYKAGGFHRH